MKTINVNGVRINLNDYSNDQLQNLIVYLCNKIDKLQKENELFKLPTPNIDEQFTNFNW